jgi:hypothetical protein
MATAQPAFVMLLGPPAVGKMTVGAALSRITGFPLFHNHMTIELVLPFFEFGSPPFTRLVRLFRNSIFQEMAASDGPGLIFTYVWAFDYDGDHAFVNATRQTFQEHGWRCVFAELHADLDTRLARNATPDRIAAKPSKRDVAASAARLTALDQQYRLTSDGNFPWPADYLHIDNSALDPAEAAHRIADHFGLAGAAVGR